jgi:hypothetical protein
MNAWIAMEHYRIHLLESWPSSPQKEASLRAARSALSSLLRRVSADAPAFTCVVCSNRPRTAVIDHPRHAQPFAPMLRPAA